MFRFSTRSPRALPQGVRAQGVRAQGVQAQGVQAQGVQAQSALATVCAALLALAGCQGAPMMEMHLSQNTFSERFPDIPTAARSEFDCRRFKGSGWKGVVSGRMIYDDTNGFRPQFEDEGCFATESQCQDYLKVLFNHLDKLDRRTCEPYTA